MSMMYLMIFGWVLLAVTEPALSACDGSSCSECASETSWWGGASCSWCFRNEKCYKKNAIANPCKLSEIVTSPDACQDTSKYNYDEALAIKMAKISQISYSETMENCLDPMGITVKNVTTQFCDGKNNTCKAFLAVSTSEKAIILSFRGTISNAQLIEEIFSSVIEADQPFPAGGDVEYYFYGGFISVWSILEGSLRALVQEYSSYDLWVTGHSLGGAMASLASTQAVYDGIVPTEKVKMVTFGAPRAGDVEYARAHDLRVKHSYRVVHNNDIVPHVPFCHFVGVCMAYLHGPYHTGTEVWYPQDEMSDKGGSFYKICYGLPFNEDQTCSNSRITLSVNDHSGYFGFDNDWSDANNCPQIPFL